MVATCIIYSDLFMFIDEVINEILIQYRQSNKGFEGAYQDVDRKISALIASKFCNMILKGVNLVSVNK